MRRARGARAGLLCAFAAVATACQAAHEPLDVVVIVIDTLRVDRLASFGASGNPAPFLDRLARRSAVFEEVQAASSWTAPATASLFTSLYPHQHGVWTGYRTSEEENLRLNRLPRDAETLPEVFSKLGYATFGVAANLNIGEPMGFARGFDRLETSWNKSARHVNETVLAWKEEIEAARPYFLYLHYMDPHWPYKRREGFLREGSSADHVARLEQWGQASDRQLRWVERELEAYDSEIGYLDARLAELFEAFGWGEGTLVVLTVDHGEEFHDHGHRRHGYRLYRELVRVPMLFHSPGRIAPRRIAAVASGVDLLPTLRELVAAPASARDRGVSLVPLLEGAVAEERPVFSMYRDEAGTGPEPGIWIEAVVSGRWKYLRRRDREGEELYDRVSDPWERDDVSASHPEVVERLRGALETALADGPGYEREFARERLTPELDARLRELGYAE